MCDLIFFFFRRLFCQQRDRIYITYLAKSFGFAGTVIIILYVFFGSWSIVHPGPIGTDGAAVRQFPLCATEPSEIS